MYEGGLWASCPVVILGPPPRGDYRALVFSGFAPPEMAQEAPIARPKMTEEAPEKAPSRPKKAPCRPRDPRKQPNGLPRGDYATRGQPVTTQRAINQRRHNN